MPKPTFEQLSEAYHSVDPADVSVGRKRLDAILRLIDETWEDGEMLREWALAAFISYGRHHPDCRGGDGLERCGCGFVNVLAKLSGTVVEEVDPDAGLPTVDDITGIFSEESYAEDLERFNDAQRIRRTTYADAVLEMGIISHVNPQIMAAQRYPLRKRVPKVIPDPHQDGRWMADAGKLFWNVRAKESWGPMPSHFALTPERIRALAALLDDPWTIEEDVSVEETT
jgi:hypothetical protein